MKFHVHVGPLPLEPPYFDWEDEDELDLTEDDEEIDMTDLLETPPRPEVQH